MKTREFLENLPDLLRQQLPEELRDFQITGPMASLIKLHYGQPTVHYEVWVRKRMKQVELGLHFEGDRESNAENLDLLTRRREEIRSALGSEVEIGPWDKGWTRAHETLALEPMNLDFLVEVSFRLSGMMRTLEPILRDGRPVAEDQQS